MKIYKYKLGHTVTVPKGARILYCNTQDKCLHVWALVDPEEKEQTTYEVAVVGTGHEFNPTNFEYITTVMDGMFVWHIWFKRVIDDWEFS